MKLAEIKAEMADLEDKLKALESRYHQLEEEQRRIESLAAIEALKITRDEVELSSGDGKPWWNVVSGFAKWMRENNVRKRFCEWNDNIYLTSEVMSGHLRPTGARMSELPETENVE